MTAAERYGYFAAKIGLLLIFINSLIGKFTGFSVTQQFMASFGFFVPLLFLIFAIIIELAGSYSLLTGYKIRYGSLLLLIFVFAATCIFHTKLVDPTQLAMFLKNIAIIGGLGILSLQGPWRSSSEEMTRFERRGYSVSRICVALIFVVMAIVKITGYEAAKEIMIEAGVSSTDMFLILAIIIELTGGLLVLLGYLMKYASLGLIVYLIPITLIFHLELGDVIQRIMFFKNIALMGGLGLTALYGARPWTAHESN